MSKHRKSEEGFIIFIVIIAVIVVGVIMGINLSRQAAETKRLNLKSSYEDFYKWVNTVDVNNIDKARWSFIDSSCGSDESCYVKSYKDYIKPEAFKYGSSKDASETLCPASEAKDYSYVCSRFGDMLSRIRSAKTGVDTDKNYSDARNIYNEIALKKS